MNVNEEKDIRPIMVSIRCTAYNHEKYIRDALEGFVMQKTNFRFEAIVHDDASTDGTAAIIREYAEKYPDIIKPIYETENQYLKYDGSFQRIMNEACKGKYIAMCECDDYWMDPYKLQKQVDFMESHTDYMMCFTRAKVIYETDFNTKFHFDKTEDREYTGNELINTWIVPTASIVYRKEIINYKIKGEQRVISGDIKLYLNASAMGKVRGMSDYTTVYRVHESGISRNPKFFLKRLEKYPDQYICILENYPNIDKKIVKKYIYNYSIELFKSRKKNKDKIKDLMKLFKYCPIRTIRWVYFLFKMRIINSYGKNI